MENNRMLPTHKCLCSISLTMRINLWLKKHFKFFSFKCTLKFSNNSSFFKSSL